MTISRALPLFDNKTSLIDKIRDEGLFLTCEFLKKRNIKHDNIIEFVRSPIEYPGNPDGPKKILKANLDKLLFKYRNEIRNNGLSLSFVYNTILRQITKRGK